ncbi:MAG: acetyl-CoA carboxylase biotin carboxyl carrier protein [Magnetococcales bacterium]|nr:acetyl-CoA carboxylase biotin carboxyl carrier protein [Magnetococcales bacterium]MBF0438163.1 acetyl-CoA carboxylase biotin carboxyl carrier protein [Magnetococcales bacterium]
MAFDLREIRQFIRFLSGTDIAEVEITEEGRTLRITRATATPPVVAAPPPLPPQPLTPHVVQHRSGQVALPPMAWSTSVAPTPAPKSNEDSRDGTVPIIAPMVGTFYKAASAESAPFVKLGDVVKKGQVVCIIEAMKLMNEIESEVSGRVVSIIKENATPVEYGEEMFLVEPA